MSTNFTRPTVVSSESEGCQMAQKYFQDTFNDNSFVIVKAMPEPYCYQCYTTDNYNNKWYYKYDPNAKGV